MIILCPLASNVIEYLAGYLSLFSEQMDDAERCINCNDPFKVKPGHSGFYRHGIGSKLPSTPTTGIDVLQKVTSARFTPVEKRTKSNRFMCHLCWAKLSQIHKYDNTLKDLWSRGSDESYLHHKRQSISPLAQHSPTSENEDVQPRKRAKSAAEETVRKTLFSSTPAPKAPQVYNYEIFH